MDLLKYTEKGMSYTQYRQLVNSLHLEGKTTGHEQTPERLEYSKLNQARMNRVENTAIQPELEKCLKEISQAIHILVLTEGWCGDSAQNVPLLGKFEEINPNIKTHYFLRDEHSELMDAFLTNGDRSIPKIIFLNESGEVINSWGPRPVACQQIMNEKKNAGASKAEKEQAIHSWYAKDKTISLQNEIAAILKCC